MLCQSTTTYTPLFLVFMICHKNSYVIFELFLRTTPLLCYVHWCIHTSVCIFNCEPVKIKLVFMISVTVKCSSGQEFILVSTTVRMPKLMIIHIACHSEPSKGKWMAMQSGCLSTWHRLWASTETFESSIEVNDQEKNSTEWIIPIFSVNFKPLGKIYRIINFLLEIFTSITLQHFGPPDFLLHPLKLKLVFI